MRIHSHAYLDSANKFAPTTAATAVLRVIHCMSRTRTWRPAVRDRISRGSRGDAQREPSRLAAGPVRPLRPLHHSAGSTKPRSHRCRWAMSKVPDSSICINPPRLCIGGLCSRQPLIPRNTSAAANAMRLLPHEGMVDGQALHQRRRLSECLRNSRSAAGTKRRPAHLDRARRPYRCISTECIPSPSATVR